MRLLKWLNPLNWGAMALETIGVVLLACGLGLYADYKLKQYYTADLKATVEAKQKEAEATRLQREAQNLKRTNEALDAKVKKLENIAANGKRIDAADDRLRDNLRASEERAKFDLSACLQRADTLDAVQLAIRGFTKRVVQECDRHTADKEALTAAWPK